MQPADRMDLSVQVGAFYSSSKYSDNAATLWPDHDKLLKAKYDELVSACLDHGTSHFMDLLTTCLFFCLSIVPGHASGRLVIRANCEHVNNCSLSSEASHY